MRVESPTIRTVGESIGSAAPSAPSPLPAVLQRHEGPFRDLDLLAIGIVLLVVLVILALRRLTRRR